MSVITREIMKFHRHKFWFPEKCVTFLMSSTSVFPSKMTVITNFLIFLGKIFLANPTFFCIVKVDFIILCHYHWFNFIRPNFFNVVPKSFTKYFSHVFILRLFLYTKPVPVLSGHRQYKSRIQRVHAFDIVLYMSVLNLVDNFELVLSCTQSLHKPQWELSSNACGF